MLKRFSDLLNSGIAPAPYQHPTFNNTCDTDKLSRLYNNVWGVLTDSRMTYDACCGIYRITGSICSYPDKFDTFLTSPHWGASIFKQATGYECLQYLIDEYGLIGTYAEFNGDKVYELSRPAEKAE